jgi:hypothetical protein
MGNTRQEYAYDMPLRPIPALGRLVPVEVDYSRTVYVTETERDALYSTYWFLGVVLVLFAASMIVKPPRTLLSR